MTNADSAALWLLLACLAPGCVALLVMLGPWALPAFALPLFIAWDWGRSVMSKQTRLEHAGTVNANHGFSRKRMAG